MSETSESPTLSNRIQTDSFWPHDSTDTQSTSNAHPFPYINTTIQGLQAFTLNDHFEAKNQITGCLVCGKSYEKVVEQKKGPDFSLQTAEPGKTIEDRHVASQVFLESFLCVDFTFPPE